MQADQDLAEHEESAPEVRRTLLQRQIAFLRKTWWSSEPLTASQRLALLLRGLLFVAVGGVGLVAAVENTVSSEAFGLQAVAKIMAEFLLIPIGILGLIILGFGGSLIVRSFVAKSLSRELHE